MGKRQFGSIRRLASGRWQARYLTPDGATLAAPATFATKAEAAAFLASVETDVRRGAWTDPTTITDVTVAEYGASWIAERTVKGRPLAPRTVDTYQHSLRYWIEPTIGQRRLVDVGPTDVRAWHQSVMSQTGPTATRQAYALLRAIFTTAVADDLVTRNPCRIRGAGQPHSPERPLIGVETVDALAAAMPDHLRAFVLIAFWGHARLGELLALRVDDVDLEAGTIRIERQAVEVDGQGVRVTTPKVGSIRTVHLPAPGIDAVTQQLSTRPTKPSTPLFARPDGSELRAHHVHAAWAVARRTVGHPELHLHDRRHAGLTLSAQSGATLAEVMRRAGHVSAAAAMRYQHAAEERDAEIAKLMTARARRTSSSSSAPTGQLALDVPE
jgi:integrase